MSEHQMEMNFEQLDMSPEEMMKLLKDLHDALAQSFVLMNWFASGKPMEEFRRVLPQDILSEVYFNLAGPYTELREKLNVPELEKMTKK